MEQVDKGIRHVDVEDMNKPDVMNDPNITDFGFYFQDETENLQGPYGTRQEAIDAMTEYGKHL